MIARAGLGQDGVVEYRHTLPDRLPEGFAGEAGDGPEVLGRGQTHRAVAGVVRGDVGVVDRRHVGGRGLRVSGPAHDQRHIGRRRRRRSALQLACQACAFGHRLLRRQRRRQLRGGRVGGLRLGVGIAAADQRLHQLRMERLRARRSAGIAGRTRRTAPRCARILRPRPAGTPRSSGWPPPRRRRRSPNRFPAGRRRPLRACPGP